MLNPIFHHVFSFILLEAKAIKANLIIIEYYFFFNLFVCFGYVLETGLVCISVPMCKGFTVQYFLISFS